LDSASGDLITTGYVLGYFMRIRIAFMTIDIALPFYGDVDFMKQTVMSILNQTDSDWRLVVVDDGYPDDSLPGWFSALNDSRVSYLRNDINLGANGNFQKCLGLMAADFCVVMGADDVLESNYIEVIRNTIRNFPDVSMIHPRVSVIDENNIEISTRSDHMKFKIRDSHRSGTLLYGESLAGSLMKGNWMYFPAITWRTKTIQEIGFRPGFKVCQDLGLAMDLIMQGGKMVLIEDEIFRYRRHTGSDSSVKAINGERFVDEKSFFTTMARDLKNIGWNQAARAAKLHSTSRLHAASLIPASIARGQNPWRLLKHLVS
jgi:glycosyltransferase involved in cell wall biosynthesis